MLSKRPPFLLAIAWLTKLTWLIPLLLISACTPTTQAYKDQFIVFGTQVNITVFAPHKPQADTAFRAIEQRFYQFNTQWHAWEKGGLISRINEAIAQQTPITIPASVKHFILKSQHLSQQSNGLFDPGIGSLIALWGFHADNWQGPPPSLKARQTWLKTHPSISDLHFNGNQLTSTNPQVALDFGGNAKGLALDIAINTLKKAGIRNAIVNIGGDMRVIGTKQGQPWQIGISNPAHPNKALAEIDLQGDESIVTSGNYERYFIWQGKKYSHIINPNTAQPAQGFRSVTVIHPDATTADAAATALMIANKTDWRHIAKQMNIQYAFLIDASGHYEMTPKMKKRLKFIP